MFSSLYLVCESHRHATALAIVLFFANLIGLGLGQFLAGVISDYLAPSYGPAESRRWGIMRVFLSRLAVGGFRLGAPPQTDTGGRGGAHLAAWSRPVQRAHTAWQEGQQH